MTLLIEEGFLLEKNPEVEDGNNRVRALGAKTVFVGSSQQFYYNICMRHYETATVWRQLK